MRLHIDFESRSTCDIKKRGSWVYSEDPTTEVLCLAIKWDGAAPHIITPDLSRESVRVVVGGMLDQATEIFAHNASFEYAIWTNICVPRYGWPPLPLEKLRCSAAKASMHSLPRSLDGACSALGLPVQKDKEGYRLMLKMCKPRKPGKGEAPAGLYWHEKPEDLERLYRYCMQDVEAEECLSNALADLPDQELKVWQLDQLINARGVQADLAGCASMLEMVGEHEQRLTKELNRLTMGAVKTGKQVEEMRKYLRGLGCDLPDLAAATVKQALKKELNDDARRILGIRQSLARSSAAKYSAIIDRASADSRVRGTLLYHGAGTGRWSGAGIQPQNFPSRIKVGGAPEEMLEAVTTGGLSLLGALYDDDPMATAGACCRSVLTAKAGHELIVADYSAIEGRGLAWLAGEEWVLQAYRESKDMYKVAAASILHKHYDDITKDERQTPGKIAELACIAEGSPVLTDAGLVPIEQVCSCMRVWDGVEYVHHQGTIFRGLREVMNYDGLQATPDHVVFTEEGREIELREAAGSEQGLAQTGIGGAPIRLGEYCKPRYEGGKWAAEGFLPVFRVPSREVDKPEQSAFRKDRGMPGLQSADGHSEMAAETDDRRPAEVPEPQEPGVQALRRAGHRVPVYYSDGSGPLGNQKPRPGKAHGDRSDQQRRPLRTGEPPVGNRETEPKQHTELGEDVPGVPQVPGAIPTCTVCGQYLAEFNISGALLRANSGPVQSTELQTKRPVWDILGAGPRNRFTVSGKLVHNCGYQGGSGAVRKFGGGEGMTDDEITEQIVKPWRDARPATVAFWKGLEDACMQAVREPGKIQNCRGVGFKTANGFLLCRLPSGRLLYYYDPRIDPCTTSWGAIKDCVTYLTVDAITKKYVRTNTYGGKIAENATQAICRDIMAEAMLRVEKLGYPLVLTIHDELVAEVPEGFGYVKDFCDIMCEVPKWASGFPIKAEGWRGKRYKK